MPSLSATLALSLLVGFALPIEGNTQAPNQQDSLPEGFSREPDCTEGTVCVSETLSLTHDDFMAVLELVSPKFQADCVQIEMQDASNGKVVVTADSGRQRVGRIEFNTRCTFLVEKETPANDWSILRQEISIHDGPAGEGASPTP